MILIKRVDLNLKKPKEKLVALFTQTAEIDEATDTIVNEQLSLWPTDWDEETTNAVKRLLGLPITKSLVYFRRINGNWEQREVISWEILKEYDEWCTLQIDVEEIGKINIHHSFLSEMQKPSFERDMEEQQQNFSKE